METCALRFARLQSSLLACLQVALVTGGSSGIGYEIARQLGTPPALLLRP